MSIGLDDLLGALHQERTTRLREQLDRIRREINTRRLVSAEQTIWLYEQRAELTTIILRLLPEHEDAPDPHRIIRQALERERRELDRELVVELRERWRDVQELRREERALDDALLDEQRKYERNVTTYAP